MTHPTTDTKAAALIFDMDGTMVDSMPHHWFSWVEFVLKHLQLNPAPDAIAQGDEGLTGKPSPAIFLEAAKLINAPVEHCIVFEDAPFCIEAARCAGMRAVANYTELLNANFLENLHVAA